MTTTPCQLDDRIRALLLDAAEWRLIARLFECPSPAWRADVAALAGEVSAADLRAAALGGLEEGTEGLYHAIFGPGGPAPPREATYHVSLELGSLLSEIAGHYDAFAYVPQTSEPPDHVAVEAGFVAYLRLKEAYALASSEDEQAAMTRRAADRFRTDHLAPLAAPLARLLRRSGVDYLASASALLAARAGPSTTPSLLPVIQRDAVDVEEEGFTCGSPGE